MRILWNGAKTETVLSKNGDPPNRDPGSPLSWDNGDPGPHYTVILGSHMPIVTVIMGTVLHCENRDPPSINAFRLCFSLAVPTLSTLNLSESITVFVVM